MSAVLSISVNQNETVRMQNCKPSSKYGHLKKVVEIKIMMWLSEVYNVALNETTFQTKLTSRRSSAQNQNFRIVC